MNIDELGLAPVAHSPAVPRYRQVKRELQRLIETGLCRAGQALPNEATLAGAMKVSIGTLRHAVDELVHDHVLVRRQGKGTFVASHTGERFQFQFFHIEPRPDAEYGAVVPQTEHPVVESLGFERDRAGEQDAAALRSRIGDAVFRFDNRLSLAGKPVAHDRITIPALLFKGLNEKRLLERPGTIYSLYQTGFGITVLRAQERARATVATRSTARMLGIAVGLPVLEVHRVALTFGDKPVEYRVSTVNTQIHDYVSVL